MESIPKGTVYSLVIRNFKRILHILVGFKKKKTKQKKRVVYTKLTKAH